MLTVDGSCKATLSAADHVVRGDNLYQVEYDLINADHCGGSDLTPSVWDGYIFPRRMWELKTFLYPPASSLPTLIFEALVEGTERRRRRHPPNYCLCPASGTQAGIHCSPCVSSFDTSAKGLWNSFIPTFQARSERLQNSTAGGKTWKRVKPRYHVLSRLSHLDQVDPTARQSSNYAWPTGSGITEKEARDNCRQSLTHYLVPFVEQCVRDTQEEQGRFTADNSSVSHSFQLEFQNPSLSICNVTSFLNATAAGLRVRLESAMEPSSNSVDYFVFDSKCRLCQQQESQGFVCFHKEDACHIDRRCWADEEKNSRGGMCNPNKNLLQWS